MSDVVVKSRDLGERWTGPVTRPMTKEQAICRWPRLVAHMICESLGYFTPQVAANALAHYKVNERFPCEWYSDQSRRQGKGLFDEETLLQVGKDVVLSAIRRRKHHGGYMSEYQNAIGLVRAELKDQGSTSDILASWF